VPTTGGTSATVQPQTSTASSDLFTDAASCSLTPQETEGPYYFDVDSIRSDIREDRTGTPLRLAMRVQDASCTPISNAVIDIWHCDAGGSYSGFESASQGGPGGGGRTDERTYLRGAQVTNGEGIAQFLTVYPGWYRGRTVHIHFKVHLDKRTLLTSQLFFHEAVTGKVYAAAPYSAHFGRDRFNKDDSIFEDSLIMTLREDGNGYLGIMSVNVAK
jgi:protocatechuate 3,4-dioxygenase beta subunit